MAVADCRILYGKPLQLQFQTLHNEPVLYLLMRLELKKYTREALQQLLQINTICEVCRLDL